MPIQSPRPRSNPRTLRSPPLHAVVIGFFAPERLRSNLYNVKPYLGGFGSVLCDCLG